MIRIVIYQNNNSESPAYGSWYPRVVNEETIGLDELAEHMASHNTPFSKGAIKGILTDAVSCTKELLLLGKNVKFPDLAIFSTIAVCNSLNFKISNHEKRKLENNHQLHHHRPHRHCQCFLRPELPGIVHENPSQSQSVSQSLTDWDFSQRVFFPFFLSSI